MQDNLGPLEPRTHVPPLSLHGFADGRIAHPSVVEACSSGAGWKSLELRRYRDPPVVESFEIPPRDAQLILLVKSAAKTNGPANIESANGFGGWQSALYRDGDVALTAPGRGARLRWSNLTSHQTLQVLIPKQTMEEVAEELGVNFPANAIDRLSMCDPTIRQMLLSVERALELRAGEKYAEAAAIFLATHLLSSFSEQASGEAGSARTAGVVDDYMMANMGSDISLGEIASVVGLSRFGLIRLCKQRWGETPMQHLNRLRMERAQRLLRTTRSTIIEIALECGYSNPSHFAVAFRRFVGTSPRAYRSIISI